MDEPTQTIRLDQFLKLCGVTATGGQAKLLIQSGEVFVNEEIEIRRGRQLRAGDEVRYDGEIFMVEQDSDE